MKNAVKHANPAGAVSRRIMESIHGQYIDELHDTMGWPKDSIVEMLLLCNGDVARLREAHQRWIVSLDARSDAGHDRLRTFLAALHKEHDEQREQARRVRRKMIESNYADWIAARVEKYWAKDDIITCLELCGSPAAFAAAFGEWSKPPDYRGNGRDFISFLRQRNVPPVDEP